MYIGWNDEYMGKITPKEAGDFIVVYRFKMDTDSAWTYCNLDDENGYKEDPAATMTSILKDEIPDFQYTQDYTCGLVLNTVETSAKTIKDYYGQVWVRGCTSGAQECNQVVGAHVLYTKDPSALSYDTWNKSFADWKKVDAEFNTMFSPQGEDVNNNEWFANFAINEAGTYSYVFAFDLKKDPVDSKVPPQTVYCYASWSEFYSPGTIVVK